MKLQRSLPGLQLISPASALTSQPNWVDVLQVTVLQQNSHVLTASAISETTDGAAPQVGTV